jgi:chromosome partitioning protein
VLDQKGKTTADVFQQVVDGRTPVVLFEPVPRVVRALPYSVLVSTPRLSDVEADAMEGELAWRRRVGSPYLVLHTALMAYLDAYDYVLIDCPPSIGVITLNGLALSDGVLIPVMPSLISTAGITQLTTRVGEFAKSLGRPIKNYGTVVNRYDSRTNSQQAIVRSLESRAEVKPLWTARISDSVRAQEGYNPRPMTLAQRWGTQQGELAALAEEFVRRVR